MNTNTITHTINTHQDNEEISSIITQKEFCIIWKKISHDKKSKPYLVEHNAYGGGTYKTKEKGWIYPEHHIIYNMLRGLPPTRGFKEGTEGYKDALNFLKFTANFGYNGYIFKPFEEYITEENFKILLLEIKNILK